MKTEEQGLLSVVNSQVGEGTVIRGEENAWVLLGGSFNRKGTMKPFWPHNYWGHSRPDLDQDEGWGRSKPPNTLSWLEKSLLPTVSWHFFSLPCALLLIPFHLCLHPFKRSILFLGQTLCTASAHRTPFLPFHGGLIVSMTWSFLVAGFSSPKYAP